MRASDSFPVMARLIKASASAMASRAMLRETSRTNTTSVWRE